MAVLLLCMNPLVTLTILLVPIILYIPCGAYLADEMPMKSLSAVCTWYTINESFMMMVRWVCLVIGNFFFVLFGEWV